MNGGGRSWRVGRFLSTVLTVLVMIVAGGYLLVYLYRWEWNRAIISGIFFIAALLAFSTGLILGSIRRVSDRLDDLEATAASAQRVARSELRAASDERASRHFDWLEDPNRTTVFIPVLLGAGVFLSALTYVLERLAGALAGSTIDASTARLLAPDLPLGPLAVPRSVPRSSERTDGSRIGRSVGWAIAGAMALLLLVAGVNQLREVTESRPDPSSRIGRTTVELQVEQRSIPRPAAAVAEALWIDCRNRLPRATPDPEISPVGSDRAVLRFEERLGDLARRRLYGCFQDARLDRIEAHVVRSSVTAPRP